MRLFLAAAACLYTTKAAALPMLDLPAPVINALAGPAIYASADREKLWPLVRAEAQRLGVPPALADAVAIVETGYTPASVGGSGEIGMMQVMPATARMLGFAGDMSGLFDPATNIHYGVMYLARAWAASGGNACRALMKYRAGTGEEGFSPLSIQYCRRAAAWLRGQDADLAKNVAANTPLVATLADPYVVSVNGRPYHPDLAALVEIADVPGMEVDRPAGRPAEAAPLVRSWHISGRGRHIQAVIDSALNDDADDHVIHIDQ
jgi:soluble lytic murein transglycosylase-like protein